MAPPTPPGPSGDEDKDKPLGLPSGYRPPGPPINIFGAQAPSLGRTDLYTEANVWEPNSWSPGLREELQAQLVAIGLLDEGTFEPGKWNQTSGNAYRALLANANTQGLDKDGMIQAALADPRAVGTKPDSQNQPTVIGGEVGGGNVYTIKLSDPASIRSLADKVGKAVLGRKPKKAEMDRIITEITGAEMAVQDGVDQVMEGRQRDLFDVRAATNVAKDMARVPTQGAATRLGHGLDGSPFGTGLAALIAAAPGKITITDGHRTPEQQAALKAKKPNLAANPGTSKHETTEAADLGFENDAVRKWAHENAPRFGLNFPMLSRARGKKYEPWHIEWPGKRGSSKSSAAFEVPGVVSVPDTYIPPTSVAVQDVDAAARTEEMLREQNPVEASAHDAAGLYGSFLSIIGARNG